MNDIHSLLLKQVAISTYHVSTEADSSFSFEILKPLDTHSLPNVYIEAEQHEILQNLIFNIFITYHEFISIF